MGVPRCCLAASGSLRLITTDWGLRVKAKHSSFPDFHRITKHSHTNPKGDFAHWKPPKSRRRYLNEGTRAGLSVEELR